MKKSFLRLCVFAALREPLFFHPTRRPFRKNGPIA